MTKLNSLKSLLYDVILAIELVLLPQIFRVLNVVLLFNGMLFIIVASPLAMPKLRTWK